MTSKKTKTPKKNCSNGDYDSKTMNHLVGFPTVIQVYKASCRFEASAESSWFGKNTDLERSTLCVDLWESLDHENIP